ncbi:putative inactive serine/threonine-protein kinase scy2 [Senna tora]|uniref:Putative inactive serine/threonine-protein kinase scy2 n=1 Tax=Senna tora TaxID=362788 RepID=A0A834T7S3_9FABA|nr:putative inactive serine/threonine-protein kinase scy2 [Senna tora]
MDSFNQSHPQTANFRYSPNSSTMSHGGGDVDDGDEPEFSGILEIYVHNARNIHNICIYENQDVYAKFSLTYNPDETLSTRIVNGGGRNPTFEENLRVTIAQRDAVLKCEIWMLSRVRNYMEDQLLGFALVPISQVLGKGKVTQEYSLSSTDLFHSPAGTVKLTLSVNTSNSVSEGIALNTTTNSSSSISSEVVLLDRKISEVMLDPVEFSRIEFPDISVVKENQQMVSEYFNLQSHACSSSGLASSRPNNSGGGGLLPFLRLSAASPDQVEDYEMAVNSPEGSIQNSGFFSSTTTSLSDDRNSADSIEKKSNLSDSSSNVIIITSTSEGNHQNNSGSSTCGPDTPTSKKGSDESVEKESKNNNNDAKFGQVFSAPLGNMNINLEAEQSAMQKQIVDMYMRSMQQFTESLAKMKLPMDLNKPDREDCGDVIQNHGSNTKLEIDQKKNDRSRVFYGSRAFF